MRDSWRRYKPDSESSVGAARAMQIARNLAICKFGRAIDLPRGDLTMIVPPISVEDWEDAVGYPGNVVATVRGPVSCEPLDHTDFSPPVTDGRVTIGADSRLSFDGAHNNPPVNQPTRAGKGRGDYDNPTHDRGGISLGNTKRWSDGAPVAPVGSRTNGGSRR